MKLSRNSELTNKVEELIRDYQIIVRAINIIKKSKLWTFEDIDKLCFYTIYSKGIEIKDLAAMKGYSLDD